MARRTKSRGLLGRHVAVGLGGEERLGTVVVGEPGRVRRRASEASTGRPRRSAPRAVPAGQHMWNRNRTSSSVVRRCDGAGADHAARRAGAALVQGVRVEGGLEHVAGHRADDRVGPGPGTPRAAGPAGR